MKLSIAFFQPLGDSAPDKMQLIPAGPVIEGRDGRKFIMEDPAAVVAATELPFVVDWEHATQLKADNGEEAPAAAWIESLEVIDGSIWGSVDWTDKARIDVEQKHYRFNSPAFIHDESGAIQSLVSAGLTNTPNFHLQALNRAESLQKQPEAIMPISQLVAEALGVSKDASESVAVNHITELKANLDQARAAAESPPMDKFVPRAEYDVALNRAQAAETALAEREKAEQETAINKLVDDAVAAGKVTPASKDYYISQCRKEGGLNEFKEFIASASPIIPPAPVAGSGVPEPADLEARCKADWKRDETIRNEFGRFEWYLADQQEENKETA